MTNEEVLAEAIRAWVDQVRPGDRGVAERATLVALNCYREGGTVSEACRQANGFVQKLEPPSRTHESSSQRGGTACFMINSRS